MLTGAFLSKECEGVAQSVVDAFAETDGGAGGFPKTWLSVIAGAKLPAARAKGKSRESAAARPARASTAGAITRPASDRKGEAPSRPKGRAQGADTSGVSAPIIVRIEDVHGVATSRRSGRVVLPPLAYWANQRTLEDRSRGEVSEWAGLLLRFEWAAVV